MRLTTAKIIQPRTPLFNKEIYKQGKNQRKKKPILKISQKAKDNREAEDEKPDNVDKKESLARDAPIADLAEPSAGHPHGRARRLGAAAPIGVSVLAAYGVGAEAGDRA